MKRKRTTRNSLKSSPSSSSSSFPSSSHQQQQQQLLSETKLSTAAASLHLPDDCWESICTFLVHGDNDSHHYIEPLSLASKQFLSIANCLRSSFTISDPTLLFIPTLFYRFPNLTSLHITSFHGDLNSLLCQISEFPFKLKSLKLSDKFQFPAKGLQDLSKKITTLTSLTCINISSFCDNHCVLISDCFPLLEELHLQPQTITSRRIRIGVEAMLIALPKLRKINLSGGFERINDDSLLFHLCKNCEFLEDVAMTSRFLTPDGIASAICQRPTLTSISFGWVIYQIQDIISSHFIDSLCQRIQHLNLQSAHFLNDHHIVTLSSFLADLVSINLSGCRKLTDSALFVLVRKCSSLSDIQMERTRIGENIVENSNSLLNFGFNPQLKSLYLAQSSSVFKDKSLLMLASILTNLQLLDLCNCNYISEEGSLTSITSACRATMVMTSTRFSDKISFPNEETHIAQPLQTNPPFSTDFFFIPDCFPLLKELNLSYPTNFKLDESSINGVKALSLTLFKLLKVNLSHNYYIFDQSLFHLFKKCKVLEEAILVYYNCSNADIAFALCERPKLRY
ncbi:hypothetical protein TSUD_258950 [Trifolium subterraneum]|uniref:COI1 F-box domain-containing protein n=1 Tax=Trifolium subterraneum TaxID=3900 RepID=A0A2Z6NH52_TRISU|nr:hypothetical protein TSUD_258950 [Trifolium subterraneum]